MWDNTGLAKMGWDSGVAPYVVLNRDYFMNGPKPGYVGYPYPHPLTLGDSRQPPLPPTNLRVTP
jgi:hypothetical protein